MSKVQWTKEIPTEDGWYWIRGKYGVELEKVKNSCVHDKGDGWIPLKLFDFEFYGPLEEPK